MSKRTKRLRGLAAACLTVIALLGGVLLLEEQRKDDPRHAEEELSMVVAHAKPRLADEAVGGYRQYIERFGSSRNKQVQDRVALARMLVAYKYADAKRFMEARAQFQTAASSCAGEGIESPSYGSVPDQATYQAAVCLAAAGQKSGAVSEYVAFLKDRPTSPLAYAVHRRLRKLDPERAGDYDALMQEAVRKREKAIRIISASCAPECLAKLLPTLGIKGATVEELTKRCGTSEAGTSLKQVVEALSSFGVRSKAMRLNRTDFAALRDKHVWLRDGHFILLERVEDTRAIVYDPRLRQEVSIRLPALDDPAFTADVVLFQRQPFFAR